MLARVVEAMLLRVAQARGRPPAPTRDRVDPVVTETVNAGFTKVFSVRLARLSFDGRLRPIRSAAMSLLIVTAWPLPLNAALRVFASNLAVTTPTAWLWLLGYTIMNAAMLGCAWQGWRLLRRAAMPLDAALDQSDQRSLADWFERRFGGLQSGISAGAALAAIVALWAARADVGTFVEVRPVSYLVVAWSAAIGANNYYWLYNLGEFAIRVRLCRSLELIPYDPATSPVIVAACRGYLFAGVAAGLGSVLIELVAFLTPASAGSQAFATAAVLFPVASVALALWVGVQPFYTTAQIVRRTKTASLAQLEADLRTRRTNSLERIMLYREISTAPLLPIATTWIVQYAAAVLGALVAYLLQRL